MIITTVTEITSEMGITIEIEVITITIITLQIITNRMLVIM